MNKVPIGRRYLLKKGWKSENIGLLAFLVFMGAAVILIVGAILELA